MDHAGGSRRTRSFDVFDTVLTRRTGAPEAVFPLLAQEAARRGLAVPAAALCAVRPRAELALAARHRRPPTLAQVHAEVARRLGLPDDAVDVLVGAEEDVERHLSVLVPGAQEMLADARTASPRGRLVFVSDTPHRPALLQELLVRAGAFAEGDRLYCSAALGATKAQGALFDLVAADLGTAPGGLLHRGDDLRSDVGSARAQGWGAELVPRGRLGRYEHIWEQDAVATEGLASWVAGSARTARLTARRAGVPGAVAEVLAGVAAPLLLGYAQHAARQARSAGRDRVLLGPDAEGLAGLLTPVLHRLAPGAPLLTADGGAEAARVPVGAWVSDVAAAQAVPAAQEAGLAHAVGLLLRSATHHPGDPDGLTVRAFLDALCRELDEGALAVDLATPAARAVRAWWASPTAAEVAAWSGSVQSWPAAAALTAPQPLRTALVVRQRWDRAGLDWRRLPRRVRLELAVRRGTGPAAADRAEGTPPAPTGQ